MPAARVPRRLALAALAAAGALVIGLSGCTTDAPEPTTSPTASADAPIFASDEEALAAAEEAYAAYLEVSTKIFNEGGSNPDRIRPFVTDAFAMELIAEYSSMAANGYHTVGATTADQFRIAQVDQHSVQTYACLGVGTTIVVDATGNDVTPADRPTTVAVMLTFVPANGEGTLLLEGSDAWPGSDFCQ